MRINSFKILAFLICLHLINPISAQYKFGIHGGIGLSNFRGPDFSDESKPKYGLVAGAYFEREINMTLSFGTEFNYEKKGCDYNYYPLIATNINSNSNLEYLSLPLMLKAYVGKNANYYFYVGISAAYLISSSNKVWATEYGYRVAWQPLFPYKFRKFDAALLIGFGVNFHEIILDFRYQYGIVDVYKGTDAPLIKNSYLSVTLGYSLYKKKVEYCFNPRRKH